MMNMNSFLYLIPCLLLGWIFYLLKLLTKLKIEKKELETRLDALKSGEATLRESFKALSSEALEQSNRSFLNLAKESLGTFQEKAKGDLDKKHQAIQEALKPVKESLSFLDTNMRNLEKERKGEQEALKQQMKSMLDGERELKRETSNLAKALRSPVVRGRWGELQLKRVVEMTGMLSHCDFYEQKSERGSEGLQRPDLIVRLPGDKQVIVDAKTPFEAYIEAVEIEDEALKEEKMKDHSKHVRRHIMTLGKKSYWQNFQPTPEFVVLFIPSETFFSAALQYDPGLIELGVDHGVIIATPTTLIGLLRAIAYGWKQEKFTRHAEEIRDLGRELYKRISDVSSHWSRVGRSLSSAVEAYNKAVGSLESRVLVTARKFKTLGGGGKGEMEPLEMIERIPRELVNQPQEEDLSKP